MEWEWANSICKKINSTSLKVHVITAAQPAHQWSLGSLHLLNSPGAPSPRHKEKISENANVKIPFHSSLTWQKYSGFV